MVNIFGIKLFEPSIEEEMRYKHGTHNRRHNRRHSRIYRNRKYRGGYTYKNSNDVSEEDITKSLNSLSKTQTQMQSRQKTKFKAYGKTKTKKHRRHN
jgi:hypothetical protein